MNCYVTGEFPRILLLFKARALSNQIFCYIPLFEIKIYCFLTSSFFPINYKFSALADSRRRKNSCDVSREYCVATTVIDINRLKMYKREFQSDDLFVTAIRPWFIFTFLARQFYRRRPSWSEAMENAERIKIRWFIAFMKEIDIGKLQYFAKYANITLNLNQNDERYWDTRQY